MSILSKFKLSNQTRAKAIASPEVRKREKMLINIDRQIRAAEASINGDIYAYDAFRYVTDVETGVRARRTVSVQVKPWWWKDMAGTYFLIVKYGNRKIQLSKDKNAIEVGAQKNLAPTLALIAEAVRTGELDTYIKNASTFGGKKIRIANY